MSQAEKWATSREVRWVKFDDSPEWIAHEAESATVYLLTESAQQLWSLIAKSGAISSNELLSNYSALTNRAIDADLTASVFEGLAMMDRAGLVQPVAE